MYNEVEFEGYWSPEDKEIWKNTDWKKRNFEDLEIEGSEITESGYFYNKNGEAIFNGITYIKCIRSNPIYNPYYKPVKTQLLIDILQETGCMSHSMYDGRDYNNYGVHDRFESQEIYNELSR